MDKKGNMEQTALAIGQILEQGKAKNVAVFDVTGLNSWADYFVIATVNSTTHSDGLVKQVLGSLKTLDLEIHPVKRKNSTSQEWVLIDLGNIIVHLMSKIARSFYELEKLWFGGTNLLEKNTFK